MRVTRLAIVVAVVGAFLLAPALRAQVATATILGHVTDSTGARCPARP